MLSFCGGHLLVRRNCSHSKSLQSESLVASVILTHVELNSGSIESSHCPPYTYIIASCSFAATLEVLQDTVMCTVTTLDRLTCFLASGRGFKLLRATRCWRNSSICSQLTFSVLKWNHSSEEYMHFSLKARFTLLANSWSTWLHGDNTAREGLFTRRVFKFFVSFDLVLYLALVYILHGILKCLSPKFRDCLYHAAARCRCFYLYNCFSVYSTVLSLIIPLLQLFQCRCFYLFTCPNADLFIYITVLL